MSPETASMFTAIGAAVSAIIALVLLIFFCVVIKELIEDAIDRRRRNKHIRKVIYCKDCKHCYCETASGKSFCEKWNNYTVSENFCSRGATKEDKR